MSEKPWSDPTIDTKLNPVGGDEILILDSEVSSPSEINKRTAIASIGAVVGVKGLVLDYDANKSYVKGEQALFVDEIILTANKTVAGPTLFDSSSWDLHSSNQSRTFHKGLLQIANYNVEVTLKQAGNPTQVFLTAILTGHTVRLDQVMLAGDFIQFPLDIATNSAFSEAIGVIDSVTTVGGKTQASVTLQSGVASDWVGTENRIITFRNIVDNGNSEFAFGVNDASALKCAIVDDSPSFDLPILEYFVDTSLDVTTSYRKIQLTNTILQAGLQFKKIGFDVDVVTNTALRQEDITNNRVISFRFFSTLMEIDRETPAVDQFGANSFIAKGNDRINRALSALSVHQILKILTNGSIFSHDNTAGEGNGVDLFFAVAEGIIPSISAIENIFVAETGILTVVVNVLTNTVPVDITFKVESDVGLTLGQNTITIPANKKGVFVAEINAQPSEFDIFALVFEFAGSGGIIDFSISALFQQISK